MRVYLDHIGCRLNEAEQATWRRELVARGHRTVGRLEDATVAVFNTCAVTAEAARDSRKRTRKLHRRNPNAQLVLTGCFATLEPAVAAALSGVDLVIPNRDKHLLVQQLEAALTPGEAPHAATDPDAPVHPDRGRTRAFIKIQDGCRNRCTFCIVTTARGEERSRTPAALVQEVNAAHADGHQEVVLTGVHIGGYGGDLGIDLRALIDALLAETTVPRIRLGSLEPWDVPPDLFDRWQDNPRLMPHLHLPLQSGSDAILRRMARRCTVGQYRALVDRARNQIPALHLTTDLIVGFPGETESDHAATLARVRELGFGHVHAFSYSKREGTAAAGFPHPVPRDVQRRRAAELHATAAETQAASLRARVGEVRPVLWERPGRVVDGRRHLGGYTDTFHRVRTETDENVDLTGKITDTMLLDLALNPTPALTGRVILPEPL